MLGFVTLNPSDEQGSLDEINRSVRDGPLVDVKLLVAVRCNDARLDPVVELATQLNADSAACVAQGDGEPIVNPKSWTA